MPSGKKTETSDCLECNRRRIKCDLAKPECQKCQKAGLQCSGAGKFRFNIGMARRGKLKSLGIDLIDNGTSKKTTSYVRLRWKTSGLQPQDESNDKCQIDSLESAAETLRIKNQARKYPASKLIESSRPGDRHNVAISQKELDAYSPLKAWLDPLSPATRQSLSYWTAHIAPVLTTFPDVQNGFVCFMLPMASSDSLINDAICVVADQHLALRNGSQATYAVEARRGSVISRLQKLTMYPQDSSVDTVVTVLLILLVGETVTGNDQFRPMMRAMGNFMAKHMPESPNEGDFRGFIRESLFGYQLCTAAFMSADDIDATLLDDGLDHFVEDQRPSGMPEDPKRVERLRRIVQTAIMIRTITSLMKRGDEETALSMLKDVRLILSEIESGSDGEHMLVWSYFMGAISSLDEIDLDFFTTRLQKVYERTGFYNIRVGLDYLAQRSERRSTIQDPFQELRELPVVVM